MKYVALAIALMLTGSKGQAHECVGPLVKNALYVPRAEADAAAPSMREFLKRYHERFPENGLGEAFRFHGLDCSIPAGSKCKAYFKRGDESVCEFYFASDGHTLALDISIAKQYRGLGIYESVLETLLALHPEVDHIPSAVIWGSTNFDVFAARAAGGLEGLRGLLSREMVGSMSKSDRAELRSQLLRVFNEVPAVRARRGVGFGRVLRVIVDPEAGRLTFDIGKGASSEAMPELLIRSSRFLDRIAPDGEFSAATVDRDRLAELKASRSHRR